MDKSPLFDDSITHFVYHMQKFLQKVTYVTKHAVAVKATKVGKIIQQPVYLAKNLFI